jgi:sulfur-oxidizing protein SoxX
MRIRMITTAAASVLVLAGSMLSPVVYSAAHGGMSTVEEGKKVAFDRRKGNCLGCHMIQGGDAPGNIGPPLVAMKARFPDKAALRAQIWDATERNPATPMPPFGKHNILTEKEIDLITDFIHSL